MKPRIFIDSVQKIYVGRTYNILRVVAIRYGIRWEESQVVQEITGFNSISEAHNYLTSKLESFRNVWHTLGRVKGGSVTEGTFGKA